MLSEDERGGRREDPNRVASDLAACRTGGIAGRSPSAFDYGRLALPGEEQPPCDRVASAIAVRRPSGRWEEGEACTARRGEELARPVPGKSPGCVRSCIGQASSKTGIRPHAALLDLKYAS